jgi:hypothetical protein
MVSEQADWVENPIREQIQIGHSARPRFARDGIVTALTSGIRWSPNGVRHRLLALGGRAG